MLGTLLHEAAHALAAARGIQDTSRQGRYHNTRFAQLARELGIDVAKSPRLGLEPDHRPRPHRPRLRRPGPGAARRHDALAPKRNPHRTAPSGAATASSPPLCPCGRTIRAAASTLAAAPITCEACGGSFEPKAS